MEGCLVHSECASNIPSASCGPGCQIVRFLPKGDAVEKRSLLHSAAVLFALRRTQHWLQMICFVNRSVCTYGLNFWHSSYLQSLVAFIVKTSGCACMTGCTRKFGVLCNYIHSDVRWCDPHAQCQSDYAVVGCLHDAIVAGREKRGSAGHVRTDTPIL